MNGRIALEDRQQQSVPNRLERIRYGTPAGGLALRRKAGIRLEAAGSAFAEPCAGCSDTLAVLKAVGHVDSNLLVGDGFARQGPISVW